MKIGSNEVLKAACIEAAATALAATAKGKEIDADRIAKMAEALYISWLEVERKQHTHDLSF